MTEQEVDRRCAIGGTVGGVVFAALVVGLFAAVCGSLEPAGAQTDGSEGPSILLIETGFTTEPPSARNRDFSTVQYAPTIHQATLLGGDRTAQRWIWYERGADVQSCVFTALEEADGGHVHAHDGEFHRLTAVGGGRECGPSHTRESENNCGFINEGYDVWAASGGSCEAFGVENCGGLECH